jgi:hypothetical protein
MICLLSPSMPEQAAIAPVIADPLADLRTYYPNNVASNVTILFNTLKMGGVA